MSIQRFRKKPVVIEAVCYDGSNSAEVIEWSGAHFLDITTKERDPDDPNHFLKERMLAIRTLEGTMIISPSDWVIRGVQGEFYPCKDSIFRATYEPAIDQGIT